jgi:hypothetical protein
VRFFKLHNGLECKVRVHHAEFPSPIPDEDDFRRGTKVEFTVQYGQGVEQTYQVISLCHPNDSFCKRTGRLLAAKKAVELCRKSTENLDCFMTKTDRAKLFQAICPEFKSGESV